MIEEVGKKKARIFVTFKMFNKLKKKLTFPYKGILDVNKKKFVKNINFYVILCVTLHEQLTLPFNV